MILMLYFPEGFRFNLYPLDGCLLLRFGAAVGQVVLEKESLQGDVRGSYPGADREYFGE